MPSRNPQNRATIARIASAKRWGNDSPELAVAPRELAADRLAAYIAKVVAAAPPLTPEQRERLAALLLVGGASE